MSTRASDRDLLSRSRRLLLRVVSSGWTKFRTCVCEYACDLAWRQIKRGVARVLEICERTRNRYPARLRRKVGKRGTIRPRLPSRRRRIRWVRWQKRRPCDRGFTRQRNRGRRRLPRRVVMREMRRTGRRRLRQHYRRRGRHDSAPVVFVVNVVPAEMSGGRDVSKTA